jgi:adenylate cyclase
MAEDETSTVKTIATYREIMSSLIEQHRGRVVDSPGDNVLAEFSSVVDAVQCAVAVQNEVQTRNAEVPENRRMEFRIGINLGDVIEEEDRLYGDGVNIAARLESMADPGGICVSKTAFDQIETKLPLGYEYLGEQSVKNIPKPVGAYRVLMRPDAAGKVIGEKRFLGRFSRKTAMTAIIVLLVVAGGLVGWNIYLQQSKKMEPASVEKMAFPLPEKPSIAVLPFDNMSDDQKQEYIVDGITENIIAALSKVPGLFVISRNSSFTYKGKPVKVQQVSEELGVRYVLEGSVQRSGDRVRIIAQLIDAIDGKHLWSERYDRDFTDIFKLQDELASKVVNSLALKLVAGKGYGSWLKNMPSNIQFTEKFFEAGNYLYQHNREANIKAKKLYKELIDLEPEYFGSYTGLAFVHYMDVQLGLSSSRRESLGEAIRLCKKAISLDGTQDRPHSILSLVYNYIRKYDEAIAEGELAIALNPNSSSAYILLGRSLVYAGRPEEAIDFIKKGWRMNPLYPCSVLSLGSAYRETGQYEEALVIFKNCIKSRPNNIFGHLNLAVTYAYAGRYEETREAWSELKKLEPKITFEKMQKRCPYRPETCDRLADAMNKAGIE